MFACGLETCGKGYENEKNFRSEISFESCITESKQGKLKAEIFNITDENDSVMLCKTGSMRFAEKEEISVIGNEKPILYIFS